MKLIIASNNKHKLVEIKQILGSQFEEILSLSQAGITHETVEDGTTFTENAIKKAREISEISGCYALADDSGICVDALGGAPGIFSARYSGEHGDDKENNRLLLKNMENQEDRKANFTCAIALCSPSGKILTSIGQFFGEIAREESGENGFGYDPLFYLPEFDCTSAELTPEEKNQISHRKKALEALLEKIDMDKDFLNES